MTDPASPAPPADRVRDAATVVLLRRDGPEPRILMGQRGGRAAFMPSKFVFPGGAVDAEDRMVADGAGLRAETAAALAKAAPPDLGPALAMAAIRELWEETGLALAHTAAPRAGPPGWEAFFAAGHRPAADRLDFIFRAITPPGRPRRFDARFFLVPAEAVSGPLDDFSRASGELSHLAWVSLAEARALDLPFITEVVLGEIAERLAEPLAPRPAPFFHHAGGRSFVTAL